MSYESQTILHPEIFDRTPLIGTQLESMLSDRAQEVADGWRGDDPNVSVVIRTRNNVERVESLFADIHAQQFDGEVQVVLVDTESNDGTSQLARKLGGSVVNIAQADFNYPRSLNLGFEAADHPYVLSLVGHSNLSNTQTLHGIARWSEDSNFGGVYGMSLPDANASKTEHIASVGLLPALHAPKKITKDGVGLLAANAAAVSRIVWQELGGFDEAFAAGGEDTELARRMLEAGMTIVREPLLSVHHSHGLGPINSLRQVWHWMQVAHGAHGFNSKQLAQRRPDLNLLEG